MSEIAIKVEKLSKVYKLYNKPIDRMKEALSISKKKYSTDHYALNNVSFDIKKGETVGIIGTNGSGKSTLLKIITGVLSPSEGNIIVKGKISALLELGAGFNPEYTGIENIYLNGTMMGYTKEEMDKKVKPIVEFADIGDFMNQPVKTYSSGMFARLAFAVAINVEPEILIVDEALAVGDVRFQIKCMDKMKGMMEGGTTVLFVSHDINSIKKFCMKAIWLNNGILKEKGEVNRISNKYLDFLKCNSDETMVTDKLESKEDEIRPFVPRENIAEIIDFKVMNKFNENIEEVQFDGYVKVRITYDVYDENIDKPVLGVAIKSVDDDYICGLNTLLDDISIPWKYGRNAFILKYNLGIRALGGKYYFDAALFEKTATIPIQYIARIKEITVLSDYIGEGKYIIPHVWGDEEDE
ncbi:ABC transporter ATP-binding protein [Clostridium sp. ZBS18]|uniref:ABC transporter ATP-binding protein n=1 Tax=Clostridium sp. ZBS18 TaxID=2949967 RepID=UPI00207AE3D6|nr:ABC transporter ATP-binding protein [Clostridium sp. ZBS18]